jgi:cellulose synthase/poly-beta-1,6-N-acetylglucosamine synthase-like glycosyltransferase
MLETALLAAVVALTVSTVALIFAGRRRWSGLLVRVGIPTGIILLLAALRAPAEAIAVGAAIAATGLLLPRIWYAAGAWFFASLVVAFTLYAGFLVRATVLLGEEPLSAVLGAILLVLEIGAMALLASSAFEMVDALCAPAVDPELPPPPLRWPVVCLQVPTYNEPPELVIETIRSLVGLDHPALRIQVIDNNTTDEALWRPVEAECARLSAAGSQVDFEHLPEWPGYKAGALNWGLANLAPDVEIVGIVDADYIVQRDWLRSTVPHFDDAAVAFVQTPQDYRAWESSAFYRACYVGFAYFFKVGMVSRARRNSIIFAGTMGLVRRSVLDQIGGWDERIITEDAEASLRIFGAGHRAVYVPTAYGKGIMPLTYEGLRKQRFRWAFGGIQILRAHWRTLLLPGSGLSFGQRYDHLIGGLWWFNDALTFGFAAFVGAAAVGTVVGRPFVVQRLSGIGLVLPVAFIALSLLRYLWALRATTGASPALALAALRVNLSLSWVIALACVRGLSQERGVFLRTPKFRGAAAIREIRLVWVETVIAIAGGLLLAAVILQAGFSIVGLTLAGLLAWSILIYASATGYALGDPTRAPIGEALRAKARLEIAPRVGRLAGSRPARAGAVGAGLIAIAIAGVVAFESGRAPVEILPFSDVPAGPIHAGGGRPAPSPSSTAAPTPVSSATPSTPEGSSAPAAGSPASSRAPGATPSPTPRPPRAPSPTPASAPTPTPVPTPTPRSTPPVPIPTPTSHPTPPPSPGRTPPPHPTASPPVP